MPVEPAISRCNERATPPTNHECSRPAGRVASAVQGVDPFKGWILYAAAGIAQPSNRPVVRPSGKLLLHRLGEHRSLDVRVGGSLRRELAIKVGRVSLVHLGLLVESSSEGQRTTLGLKLGSYFRSSSFLQSMLWKK